MPANKEKTIYQGDSFDLGFKLSSRTGPLDLSIPGTVVRAQLMDSTGTRAVASFDIRVVDASRGHFIIHLSPEKSQRLRGKYFWFVRFEQGARARTLQTGYLIVKAVNG